MKIALFAPLALAFGTLALGGCGSQPAKQAAAQPRSDAPEGITITDGRLVLPAVKGNPGAVYFTVHNDAADALTISGATVKGAKSAMIHQMSMANGVASMDMVSQIAVPAMGTLAFKPGGLHLMAMDLDDSLAKGGTTVVSLTFAGGDTATFPVEILAAGDAR
jgi:copper(I)-binding protein